MVHKTGSGWFHPTISENWNTPLGCATGETLKKLDFVVDFRVRCVVKADCYSNAVKHQIEGLLRSG